MAWIFSGMSESDNCYGIKHGRRWGVPGGACELVMDVCNFHFMVRKGFTEVIIFELRPDALNLADRKPEVLS